MTHTQKHTQTNACEPTCDDRAHECTRLELYGECAGKMLEMLKQKNCIRLAYALSYPHFDMSLTEYANCTNAYNSIYMRSDVCASIRFAMLTCTRNDARIYTEIKQTRTLFVHVRVKYAYHAQPVFVFAHCRRTNSQQILRMRSYYNRIITPKSARAIRVMRVCTSGDCLRFVSSKLWCTTFRFVGQVSTLNALANIAFFGVDRLCIAYRGLLEYEFNG